MTPASESIPPETQRAKLLRNYRVVLGLFILGLILSGVTAFPLEKELGLIAKFRGFETVSNPEHLAGVDAWIFKVQHGLLDTYSKYPWMGYGTDWLAFGHIVIALFFIGPWMEPVRNAWVLKVGLVACGLVIPLALICGEIRQIPFGWRLIDCSFGLFGAIPLWYCLTVTRKLEPTGSS